MKSSDRYYLEARAEEEIERARQSTDERAVASHHYLAELYLQKLHGAAPKKNGPAPAIGS